MDEQTGRRDGATDHDPHDSHHSPGGADAPVDRPEFGPGGYLPDRASRRARKIILRAPMGIQWVIGALVVGLVVLVAGWFALRDGAPGEPFVEVPGVIGEASVVTAPQLDVIATDAGGRPRAFAWADGDTTVVYCDESGLLEAADGRAWRVTGRGVNGVPSLLPAPTVVHDGRFYVDPTTTLQPPAPDPDAVATACVD